MMTPLDMAASTTVVGNVWTTLRVTNEADTVTGDVNRGIQVPFATKVCSIFQKLLDKRRLGLSILKFHYTVFM